MNDFFDGFEADVCFQFKLWPLAKKAEVEDILKKETETKQAKLESKALADLEAKLKEEERLREEEAKKTGKPPAKAPPPVKKPAGKDEKPVVDVPKLPIPQVTLFKSVMGNQYVRERQYTEIAGNILEPPKEEEEQKLPVNVTATTTAPVPVAAAPSS